MKDKYIGLLWELHGKTFCKFELIWKFQKTILQWSLFPLCSSVLKEVCRKVPQKSWWDGTKSVSDRDRRRSGQMAVSTEHVNNQIENKLNRLSVCCCMLLHFGDMLGIFSVVITVPYSREVKIFKLEVYMRVKACLPESGELLGWGKGQCFQNYQDWKTFKKSLQFVIDFICKFIQIYLWHASHGIILKRSKILVPESVGWLVSFSEKVWKVVKLICDKLFT